MNVPNSFMCTIPKLETTQMLFTGEGINKLWYILKWNTTQQQKSKLEMHTTTWINLKGTMLSGKCQFHTVCFH